MKKNKILLVISSCGLLLILLAAGIFSYSKYQAKESKKSVSYLFEDLKKTEVSSSLKTKQEKVDVEINKYINDDKFTLNKPKVIVNPYGISPLTAIIIFTTKEEEKVNIKVNNASYNFSKNKTHVIPIYGLYPDKSQDVIITLGNKKTNTVIIKTEKLNELYKPLDVKTANKTDNGYYFVTSPMTDSAIAYDNKGDIRWYLTANYHNNLQVLKNGHILLSNDLVNDNMASATGFVEIDYLGKVYNEYIVQGGYHHDILEMENGDFLVASSNYKTPRSFDYIIQISRETGRVKDTWDLYEIVSKIDKEFASKLSTTWAWNNSIFYDKKTNQLVLSLRNRNSVIAIGYQDKLIKWIFGEEKNWSSKFSSYLLKTEGNMRYPKGQHSAFISKEGYLGLFNNDYDTTDEFKLLACSSLKDNYSSANLYEIKNKTIKEIWQFDHNKELFSYALSNFYILNNNHKLINFGWEFSDKSYSDPNCTQFNNTDISSTLIELDKDDKIVFEGVIPQGKYRVKKINMYNKIAKTYSTKKYNYFYEQKSNLLKKISAKTVEKELKAAPKFNFNLNITSSYFTSSSLLPDSASIQVAFVSTNGEIYIYSLKEKNKEMLKTVYLEPMKNDYSIFIIWDSAYKNLNKIVTF